MVLAHMQPQEIVGREVLAAFRTAGGVCLGVVDLEVREGEEGDGLVVGGEGAFHYWRWARCIGIIGGLDVFWSMLRSIGGGWGGGEG